MNNISCSCNYINGCAVLSVLAGIIAGIVTTLLSITAVIAVTPAFLWVLFGIAVGYLAITLLKADSLTSSRTKTCVCTTLGILFTGILGTILTAIILLGITFAATSITGAIITGLLLTFFTLIITATICLIKCIANCNTECDI